MDMSKLSQGQMIAAVGGIVLILSLFLDWGPGVSGWQAFSGMDIIMLVIGAAAVAFAALPAAGADRSLPAESAAMLLVLAVAIVGFTFGTDLELDDADIGAWLALLGAAAIAYGAFESMRGSRAIARMSSGSRRSAPPRAAPPTTAPPPPESPAAPGPPAP